MDLIEIIVLTISALIAIYITIISIQVYKGNKYLCDTCKFNQANDCNKPERPHAHICMSYSQID
jgi:hypothetical protein